MLAGLQIMEGRLNRETGMKNETGLRIMTAEGELRGCMDDDLFVFKGIPYAAAPLGALRWRPPQPVTPWQQVRDAVITHPTMSEGLNIVLDSLG